MKHFSLTLLGALALSATHEALASSNIVEVPVARVFISATGFDDNDTIEAVVDGELPNSCYTLEKQEVELDQNRREIRIKQWAVQQTEGLCATATPSNLPQLSIPVPFTDTVTLGRLKAGAYKIIFYPVLNQAKVRNFAVGVAPVRSADSLPYATVTEISVADLVREGHRNVIEINGILNNSCYSFNDKIGVEMQGDVVVILPTVKIDDSGACLMYTRPFQKYVDLGPLPAQRYLVHVRSMHGKSLNRVFSVLSQNPRK